MPHSVASNGSLMAFAAGTALFFFTFRPEASAERTNPRPLHVPRSARDGASKSGEAFSLRNRLLRNRLDRSFPARQRAPSC